MHRLITPRPEIGLYRSLSIGLLRRYFRLSMELGRLPSLVGREFFRAKVTSYRMHSFEDVVILCHDVERCLAKLDRASQEVIARVILEEHSQEEAARLLNLPRTTLLRNLIDGLDVLTEIFLETGLLRAADVPKRSGAKSCQEGEIDEIAASA